ncbi:hypothetical protein [Noviherbaspirillum malthae]|uniref:hypothetical protein n=1 Tax=Noviherbaspirillum malthae TaxID=1260987 RepID=UPI00188FB221|nr:hypothetical protein [Noviherbaspirillum malthae]
MAWPTLSLTTIAPPLLAALALQAAPAHAQQSSGTPKGPQRTAQREQALDRQLATSEARAAELQRRIEQLEQRLEQLNAAETRAVPGPTATAPRTPAPSAQAPAVTPASAANTTATAASRPAARPGSFEVDENAAQRALERTLTQSGALLLPQGAISITPGFAYTRTELDSSVLVDITNPATGATSAGLAGQTLRRNEFTARVDVRAGLPMESQLEIGLPYQYVRSSLRDAFSGEARENGSGIGDLTIGLAKTLVREKGAVPDVIGRVAYNTGSSRRTDGLVTLGGGYRQVAGEVVALKRQDPLAFFAGASYGHYFEKDGIKPGAVTNLTIGTVLAASPATSLQFGFTQTHRQKQEANGLKLSGSDETYGTINIGASSVLSRDVMLIVSTGIGVGSDAPKYSFNVSLPISFR